MTLERLHKFLSRAGVASRRKAEEMILEGKVKVNGRVVADLGVKIDPDKDRVQVEGKKDRAAAAAGDLHAAQALRLRLHHHGPRGPPHGDGFCPPGRCGRLYPVGRLDYDATGLMLLTNDGDLAQRLTHPRYEVPRTYRVTVEGEVGRRPWSAWRAASRWTAGRCPPKSGC
jgi:23S rRNA pseudouridine2605 synthase